MGSILIPRLVFTYTYDPIGITTELGDLENLTEIYARRNKLTRLPSTIGNLKALESLYLENNKLTSSSFPDEMGEV